MAPDFARELDDTRRELDLLLRVAGICPARDSKGRETIKRAGEFSEFGAMCEF